MVSSNPNGRKRVISEPYIPQGSLTPDEAIEWVAETTRKRNRVPKLTQREKNILVGLRVAQFRAMHPKPKPATPVTTIGIGGKTHITKASGPQKRKVSDPETDPPELTNKDFLDFSKLELDGKRETISRLEAKESRVEKHHQSAQKCLRELCDEGRVPVFVITDSGPRGRAPHDVWGGNQWDKLINNERVTIWTTLGNVTGRPMIRRKDLEAAFSPDGTVRPAPALVARESNNDKQNRGRKAKWNWDGAIAHLISIANGLDGLPETQADIERIVQDWFVENYDGHPAESSIRSHVTDWCAEVLNKADN